MISSFAGPRLVYFGHQSPESTPKPASTAKQDEPNPFDQEFEDTLVLSSRQESSDNKPKLQRRKTTDSTKSMEVFPVAKGMEPQKQGGKYSILSAAERELYRWHEKNGELYDAQDQPIVPPDNSSESSRWYTYFVTKDRGLFGCPRKPGDKGHISFGDETLVCGENMASKSGKILWNTESGTFKPPGRALRQLDKVLNGMGVNTNPFAYSDVQTGKMLKKWGKPLDA